MFRKTSKLVGLLLLLILSFMYTNSVFKSARASDPIMQEVIKYKEKNDIKPKEPIITDDEIILGTSGLVVNAKKSYDKMKENDKFNKEQIVYESKIPSNTISKTYDYYIKQGNQSKKQVALIIKIDDNVDDIDGLLKLIAKYDVSVNFFVDGNWLESNVDSAFSIINLDCELYNLGYQGKYDKKMISITNNLIESISLKKSNLCLSDDKNDDDKEICKKKKMYTLTSTLKDPDIADIKKGLVKGAIISYSFENLDTSNLGLIINTITSRGYEIKPLSEVIKE